MVTWHFAVCGLQFPMKNLMLKVPNDRGQHQRVVRLKRCLLTESWLYSKIFSNTNFFSIPLKKKTIEQGNSWTETERKKFSGMLIAHFWCVKFKKKISWVWSHFFSYSKVEFTTVKTFSNVTGFSHFTMVNTDLVRCGGNGGRMKQSLL